MLPASVIRFAEPMRSSASLFIAACLFSALTPGASGQEAAPKKEAEKGRHIRGLSFRLEDKLDEVYCWGDKVPGVKIEVKNYLNDIAGYLPFDGSTDLVLTNSPDPKSVQDPAAVLAKVKFQPAIKSAVFMILPGTRKEGDPKYRVLVLEDGVGEFPPGSLKLMNLSPAAVRMQLENQNFDVKSGEIRLIKNPPTGENHNAAMSVFYMKGDKWQMFGNSAMVAPDKARVFEVFFENPASGKVEMRGIRDVAFDNP